MELLAAASIFSQATGFLRRSGYAWTCNPYVGCTYGCTYCYAMFLPQNRRPLAEWGRWLVAKENAVELARREARRLAGQAVYMSSVTDPYLPVEQSLQLTRGILQAMLPHQPRLTIQTRGPLVVRDIDLLRQFQRLRVNMSITTDSEEIRRLFEPKATPLEQRWAAIRQLRAAGVAIGICVTPTLPLQDPATFVRQLVEFAPEVLVVQTFEDACGGWGADTGPAARQLLPRFPDYLRQYQRFVDLLQAAYPVYEGEAGFFPP